MNLPSISRQEERSSSKGRISRAAACACGSLLEGVRQTQKLVLAPGAAREGDAKWIVGCFLAVDPETKPPAP